MGINIKEVIEFIGIYTELTTMMAKKLYPKNKEMIEDAKLLEAACDGIQAMEDPEIQTKNVLILIDYYDSRFGGALSNTAIVSSFLKNLKN